VGRLLTLNPRQNWFILRAFVELSRDIP